jgi:pimeloyl-ACP methyl ester carboxylesterase
MRWIVIAAVLVGLLPAPASAAVTPSHVEGVLADGSTYVMDVPARWNGTVLLYSHGYVPDGAPNPAFNAPSDAVRTALLDAGYAQIGSSYPETGWVLERALPAQLSTLDTFGARFGHPRRVIAWGTSLGGMITTGLAERHGNRFAGTLAMCGLEQGGVANWNSTLDPLFALRTLLTPGATTALVRLPDQAAAFTSIGQLTAALDAAQATPEGRARIALAAALHNIPAWTDAAQPPPAPGDYDTAQRNQFGVLHLTVYVGLSWRQEAEQHAGGNMSWNTGVDYGRMLERSSIRDEVHALYARAGLSLEGDLATLAAAPRISADPNAIRYMAEHISFSGRLIRPMLTIHTTGDPLVPVQVQHAYADAVAGAHRSASLRQAFVDRGGHCTFTTGEMLAALRTLQKRIDSGRWPDTGPQVLNRLAAQLDPSATPAYVDYRPAPYPRPFNLNH